MSDIDQIANSLKASIIKLKVVESLHASSFNLNVAYDLLGMSKYDQADLDTLRQADKMITRMITKYTKIVVMKPLRLKTTSATQK